MSHTNQTKGKHSSQIWMGCRYNLKRAGYEEGNRNKGVHPGKLFLLLLLLMPLLSFASLCKITAKRVSSVQCVEVDGHIHHSLIRYCFVYVFYDKEQNNCFTRCTISGGWTFLVSSPLLRPQILLYVSPNYFSKTILDCCLSQLKSIK